MRVGSSFGLRTVPGAKGAPLKGLEPQGGTSRQTAGVTITDPDCRISVILVREEMGAF